METRRAGLLAVHWKKAMEKQGRRWRELLVHDALAFVMLTLITVVLFGVTLGLFRSFSAHREDQAKEWAARGEAALRSGRAEEAVQDLRTALTFAPDMRAYELLLAQSLAAAGPKHTDEAYNYFLELRDAQPGDGQINLGLARLAARRGDEPAAAQFYRGAIDGNWTENGAEHRRDVRLELAQYLIGQRKDDPARVELLVVGSNWTGDAAVQAEVGGLLARAGDTADGLAHYRQAIELKADDATVAAAGRLAYQAGEFDEAAALLHRAGHGLSEDDAALLEKARRLAAMEPSSKLSAAERVRRLVAARAIARRRWESCTKQTSPPAIWMSLATRWQAEEATANIPLLLRDTSMQDLVTELVYDTETATSQFCGAPTGNDALLLTLAQSQGQAKAGGQ